MPPQLPMIPFPYVNGHMPSFSSVRVWFKGQPYPNIAFRSINFEVGLEPGEVRGTDSHLIGMTRGVHTATADAEIYLLAWEPLKRLLGFGGIGYGEQFFNIVVQWREQPTVPIVTVTLENYRITKSATSNQQGSDPTTVKLTLKGMDTNENGSYIAVPLGS